MILSTSFLVAIPFFTHSVLSHSNTTPPPPEKRCPPFSGNFTIHAYQLYPENADFSTHDCNLYIGQLWNASLGIYNPYNKTHTTVSFPNITHNPALHLGAVAVEPREGKILTMIADAGAAFNTNGEDVSGTNWMIQMDTRTREVLREVNLTETSGGVYGGFQDADYDPEGNVFVVGTWPGTLLKVDREADGDGSAVVTPWYLPEEIVPTQRGFGGIAAWGWMLLAQGDASGKIFRFDMRDATGTPYVIPFAGNRTHTFGDSDAIYLPIKYGGKVLVVAEDQLGLSIFRSKDGLWDEAEYVGTVDLEEKDKEDGTSAVAAVQVGQGIYMVREPFGDVGLGGPGTAGNRSDFVFWDVEGRIQGLLDSAND